jgi:chemotaxis response regulator CheB
VVFGMPKAAIERGFALRVVPLELLANALVNHCSPERIAKEEKVHLQL